MALLLFGTVHGHNQQLPPSILLAVRHSETPQIGKEITCTCSISTQNKIFSSNRHSFGVSLAGEPEHEHERHRHPFARIRMWIRTDSEEGCKREAYKLCRQALHEFFTTSFLLTHLPVDRSTVLIGVGPPCAYDGSNKVSISYTILHAPLIITFSPQALVKQMNILDQPTYLSDG